MSDPALVPSALAQVLRVKESAGQPMVSALCSRLRAQEALLVLDNCEHVLEASARLAEVMLREAARVTIVATSREPLRIDAERTYPLGALPLPDPRADAQAIASSDAVQLFVDRARQRRPDFDLREKRARAVAEICVRLDGIPLALELAAARVAVLPVDQIVPLLDQRFRLLTGGSRNSLPRHQTLRASIDWSYDLLDEAEKRLFARLAVFAGGWTRAAAEVVGGGPPIVKDDVLYLLIGLVEKSLVVVDQDGAGERTKERAKVLHAAGTLAYIQGDYSAAWALLEEILATRRQLGDRKGIAHTLNNLGILTRQQGDFASARALHDESLAIRRELGDRLGVCPLAEQPGPRGQAIELALEKTVRHP